MGRELATERIGKVNGRIRSTISRPGPRSEGLTVAVALICHNYGRFLKDCWSSVASQSRPANEVVVIDDSSTDNTQEVARELGVPYHRIDRGHQYYSMKKAMDLTSSDILCFLDADDILSPNYLEAGLGCFSSYNTGVVYSDIEQFGSGSDVMVFSQFSHDNLERENFIHAGSLVRREALVSSMCLDGVIPEDMSCATDWFVWKRLCRQGWKGIKQPTRYKYRIHKDSTSNKNSEESYFTKGCLASEPVTFFLPLSGRTRYWNRMARFLNGQTWPRNQVQIVLMDTSGSKKFHKTIRKWAFSSDYDDVRVMKFDVGEKPGQADDNRRDDRTRHAVQRAVARIYNKIAREISTEFLLTIEDDVLPPIGVVKTLLEGFDPSTASVAAPLLSRFHDGYLHWKWPKEISIEQGRGVEEVAGSGFGCTMIRRSAIKDTVFTSNPSFCNGDFDGSFFHRLKSWKAKVQWDCSCIHGEQGAGSS